MRFLESHQEYDPIHAWIGLTLFCVMTGFCFLLTGSSPKMGEALEKSRTIPHSITGREEMRQLL